MGCGPKAKHLLSHALGSGFDLKLPNPPKKEKEKMGWGGEVLWYLFLPIVILPPGCVLAGYCGNGLGMSGKGICDLLQPLSL